jgi:hypothetical protein
MIAAFRTQAVLAGLNAKVIRRFNRILQAASVTSNKSPASSDASRKVQGNRGNNPEGIPPGDDAEEVGGLSRSDNLAPKWVLRNIGE